MTNRADGAPSELHGGEAERAAWEGHAEAAIKAVEAAIAPRLKRAAESVYDDLLYTVQDYLLENVLYNVKANIAAADRQALYDRTRAAQAERRCDTLQSLLREAVSNYDDDRQSGDLEADWVARARAALQLADPQP
jgi:hypothetical protein